MGSPLVRVIHRGHGFDGAPVWFKEGLHRDDAGLRTPLGTAEAWLFRYGLAAEVVGISDDFVVFGPMRDKPEAAKQCHTRRHRVIAQVGIEVTANKGALVARTNITSS